MSTYYSNEKVQHFRCQVCQRAMAWLEVTNTIIGSENLETFPSQYYPLQASQEWKTINTFQSANLPVSTRITFLLRSWIEYGALVLNMDGTKGKWGRRVAGKKPESQSFWMTDSSYPILCQTALAESNHIEDISVYHLPFPASLPRRLETLHVCQSTGLTHSILQHYLLFLEYILIISTKIRPTFNSFAQIPSLNICLKWPLPSWALQHVMLLGGLCDLDHSLVCVVTFQKTWSTKLES